MSNAIIVDHVTKSYGSNIVLNQLSFQVKSGTIFAILGINGAGKTTLLECMEGLRKYDGTITYQGEIGVQLQSSSLPHKIKVHEAIQLFAVWNHKKHTDDIIQKFHLEDIINHIYETLSTGQKRRLHLAIAMLHNPDILFLDEPTAGLDIEGRILLHQILLDLKEQGKTIVLASHDMAEVEQLCSEMIVLKHGTICFQGTADAFKTWQATCVHVVLKLSGKLPNLNLLNMDSIHIRDNLEYHITCQNLHAFLLTLLPRLEEHQIRIEKITSQYHSLEDQFRQILQEE